MISGDFRRFPEIFLKNYEDQRICDVRITIYEMLIGAGIKGVAMPQSACYAGKQRRSATLSTISDQWPSMNFDDIR
jgi:hypothetical protein